MIHRVVRGVPVRVGQARLVARIIKEVDASQILGLSVEVKVEEVPGYAYRVSENTER
jgi:hypothetical protein